MLALHVVLLSIALVMGFETQAGGIVSPTVIGAAGREATLGQNFDLRIGETVDIAAESLTATFDRVVEDSRCPTNVTCIWAGDAVVRVTLRAANGQSGTVDLHTQSSRERAFQKYRLRLVELNPAPQDGRSISAEQYVATFVVLKDE